MTRLGALPRRSGVGRQECGAHTQTAPGSSGFHLTAALGSTAPQPTESTVGGTSGVGGGGELKGMQVEFTLQT